MPSGPVGTARRPSDLCWTTRDPPCGPDGRSKKDTPFKTTGKEDGVSYKTTQYYDGDSSSGLSPKIDRHWCRCTADYTLFWMSMATACLNICSEPQMTKDASSSLPKIPDTASKSRGLPHPLAVLADPHMPPKVAATQTSSLSHRLLWIHDRTTSVQRANVPK